VILAVLCVLLALPAAALGAGTGLLVTFAARVCPNYTDITANRARNDIQESLRDLGADTPYQPGQAMDPAVEAEHQPNCAPLPGWTFTLGTGYKTRAVSGPWGSLSIVTGPFAGAPVTQDSTALLDTVGRPTGQSIAGATTVELTQAQAQAAARPNSLWVQGGTPSDPILNEPHPGEYGFGALRCAIDDLNGDNVEWVGFPTGTTHVFCFAYYVQPPPTSGTIIIRKQIQAPAGTAESFSFRGNLSFNGDGMFTLPIASGQTSAQQTFIRGQTRPGEPPWTAQEIIPPNWRLSGLTCTSQTGASHSVVSLATASLATTLAPADTVTCTYTDEFVPPPGGLLIRKITLGATGHFGFSVAPASGGAPFSASATTIEEGLAADAVPGPLSLPAGSYSLTESSPHSHAGRWSLTAVSCNGHTLAPAEPIKVSISSGAATVCTLTNTFEPLGAITLAKITRGSTATTGFVISPTFGEQGQIHQSATTTHEGVPANASGDPSHHLVLGRYVIQETTPEPVGSGQWVLSAVQCNGHYLPFASGQATVTLTTGSPSQHCVFTNTHLTAPLPPLPPGPDEADLSVSKRARQAAVILGSSVDYVLTVQNHGPGTAQDVVVVDQPSGPATLVFAHPSQGSCSHTLPIRCLLGQIAPGGRAVIAIRMTPHAVGPFTNGVVGGAATPDPSYAGDKAFTTVHVKPPGSGSHPHFPSFTG